MAGLQGVSEFLTEEVARFFKEIIEGSCLTGVFEKPEMKTAVGPGHHLQVGGTGRWCEEPAGLVVIRALHHVTRSQGHEDGGDLGVGERRSEASPADFSGRDPEGLFFIRLALQAVEGVLLPFDRSGLNVRDFTMSVPRHEDDLSDAWMERGCLDLLILVRPGAEGGGIASDEAVQRFGMEAMVGSSVSSEGGVGVSAATK